MSKYPPTVEIPVSESARNLQEVTLKLLFDEPKEFEGKFGTQYKYSVELNGEEQTLFASNALHRKIQELYPSKGSEISVARFGTGKETKWDVILKGGPGGSRPSASQSAAKAPPASGGSPSPRGNPQTFVEKLSLYWDSFELALDSLTEMGIKNVNVDVNAVAFVIYKLAEDNNVRNPSDPLSAVVNTTETAESQGKNKMLDEITAGFTRTGLEEDLWLTVINMHNEGEAYTSVDQLAREVGVAVWASIKNVEAGTTTWADMILPVDAPF